MRRHERTVMARTNAAWESPNSRGEHERYRCAVVSCGRTPRIVMELHVPLKPGIRQRGEPVMVRLFASNPQPVTPNGQAFARRRRANPPIISSPPAIKATVAGSGTTTSGMRLPNVTSSNTIWLAAPANDTDCAVPVKPRPAATNGQNPALYVGAQLLAVVPSAREPRLVPVPFRPLQTVVVINCRRTANWRLYSRAPSPGPYVPRVTTPAGVIVMSGASATRLKNAPVTLSPCC